jgi:histidinol phosphatase-like PHP family hydrolase
MSSQIRSSIVSIFASFLLISGLTACDNQGTSSHPEGIETTVEGKVMSLKEDNPIEGATVTVFTAELEDTLGSATTDSCGMYEASFVVDKSSDEVKAKAEADDYEAAEKTVALSREISVDLSLQLTPIEEGWAITKNPYGDVDWDVEHHKANFHTHTAESPDAQRAPSDVIDSYHAHDYSVLALTDHNNVTWPWQEYGRDPAQLGMTAIQGNELSRHDHNLSLFTGYPAPIRDESTDRIHTSLQEVSETDGLSVLAHPGRYWKPEQERVPDEALAKYLSFFREYDALVGIEVHNKTDRYPWDRRLWDALLERLMPERTVWGFANDDSHQKSTIGLNANWFPIQSRDSSNVRQAMERGAFYFGTVTTHSEDRRDMGLTPKITDIEYDRETNTLTLTAEVKGNRIDSGRIKWISSRGEVVAEGNTIDLSQESGLSTYLRAEIRSEGALTYTQPFGLEKR